MNICVVCMHLTILSASSRNRAVFTRILMKLNKLFSLSAMVAVAMLYRENSIRGPMRLRDGYMRLEKFGQGNHAVDAPFWSDAHRKHRP